MRVTGSKIKSFFENEHTIFGWEFYFTGGGQSWEDDVEYDFLEEFGTAWWDGKGPPPERVYGVDVDVAFEGRRMTDESAEAIFEAWDLL